MRPPGKEHVLHGYWAYGFRLNSQWQLPEGVRHIRDDSSHHNEQTSLGGCSLDVRRGQVSWSSLREDGEDAQFGEEHHRLYWPVLGRVELRFDGRVTVEPHAEAPRGIVAHAILGPISAHWLLMQGQLPLHANCVNVDGQLIAVVGPSGAGKSSLSGALIGLGALPHSDDVLAVDSETGLCPFGSARIKLNPDVLESLNLNAHKSVPVYEGIEKRSLALPFPEDLSAKQLALVYRIVDSPQGSPPEFVELNGFIAALSLMSEIFRIHLAKDAFGAQSLLDRCAKLVGTVRVFELRRPRDLGQIQDLAKALMGHARSLRVD